MRTAVVVGAGIGGVTAALALQQTGWQVTLLERSATTGEIGAGLAVWPPAATVLERLGVQGVRRGPAPVSLSMRLANGRTIMKIADLGDKAPVMIHRAQLHDRITDRFGSAITLRTGFTVTGVESGSAGASVQGEGESIGGDLVVAADGLRSTIRHTLHPRHRGPLYAGYTSYRGISDHVTDSSGETWGRGRRFGCAPMVDGRTYWFGGATQPEGLVEDLAVVQAGYAGWHDPIPAIVGSTAELIQRDIYDLALPLPSFASGRVALLGDAAHAMTPNLGRGANSAIEDAAALAAHLTSAGSIADALLAYDAERRPVTTRLVRAARRVGQLGQVRNPVGSAVVHGLLTAVGALASLRSPRGG